MRSRLRILGAGLALVLAPLLTVGCGDDNETAGSVPANQLSADTAIAWFNLELRLVQLTAGFSPPVASRAFGYSGVALYEAVVGGMPGHRSLAGSVEQLAPLPAPESGQVYDWPAVANAALATLSRELFVTTSAENHAAIDALESELEATFTANSAPSVLERSAALGEAIGEAIFAWSRGDGGHEGYLRNFPSDYTPPAGPGMWEATPPGFQRALQPYWGGNRPFALTSDSECDPGPPPAYSTQPGSVCYQEGLEVYDMSQSLTAEQEAIAYFWSDDPGQTATPPGHSISILTQLLTQSGATLDVAAEAYAKLGMAVADAFISCWSTKFRYNLLRPVTYVQNMFDPEWMPMLNTPPFPEYTSGHSVQSGAATEVLTELFGTVAFTDHTHDARGLAPRSFASFDEAADEAAISRMYGGIHFRTAIDIGLEQGRCVGDRVNALRFRD